MLETEAKRLVGSWAAGESGIELDQVGKDIEKRLGRMQRVATSECGWETLFYDDLSDEYWELTYPQSHLHGGGPKALSQITQEEAESKYRM